MTYQTKRTLLVDLIDEFKTDTGGNFLDWVYDVLFELDEDEIPSDELIEGTGEKQIDVLRVEDDPDSATAKVFLLQTKATGGFAENVVVLISNGISTILETSKTDLKKLKNQTLASKILEIRELLKKYGPSCMEFHVVYATLGNSQDVGSETKAEIKKVKKRIASTGFKAMSFELLGAAELYDLCWRKRTSDRILNEDVKIIYDVNRASIIEFQTDDYKAVVCTVSGHEIARLAALEPTDAIFDMNLRGHLGAAGRVNSSIMSACTDAKEAERFWFKNNGITMVCSHLDVIKDPDESLVKVENVQIINGCQTSVTLREAKKEGALQDEVRVLTKIYQLTDAGLINNIVLATNNQNSIVSRDLFANDESQILIQQSIEQKLGLFYEKKRGEARAKKIQRTNTIDSEKAGQAYLAIVKKLPTISRAQKYRIYEGGIYYDVFRKSHPLRLALCYYLYEYCKKEGRKKAKALTKGEEQHSLLTYGVFHLSRAFAYFVFNSETLPSDEAKVISQIKLLRDKPEKFAKSFALAVKISLRVLKKAKAASANNYFKSQLAQDQLTAAIAKLT